jgi:hypothetical protein
MKKVIERLEEARLALIKFSRDTSLAGVAMSALSNIEEALMALQSPCWRTPEQWEKRTGKKWPDNGAVYYKNSIDGAWYLMYFAKAKKRIGGRVWLLNKVIVCANEAGKPPDGWEPEGLE